MRLNDEQIACNGIQSNILNNLIADCTDAELLDHILDNMHRFGYHDNALAFFKLMQKEVSEWKQKKKA